MTTTYDWKSDVEEQKESIDPELQFEIEPEASQEPESDSTQLYQVTAPKKLSDRPLLLIGLVFGGLTSVIVFVVLGYMTFSTMGNAISSEKNKDTDTVLESFNPNTPFNQESTLTEEERLRQQLTEKETDANITKFNSSTKKQSDSSGRSPNPQSVAQAPPAPPPQTRVTVPKIVYRDRTITRQAPAPEPKVVYRDRTITKTAPAAKPLSAAKPSPVSRPSPVQSFVADVAPQDPYEQWNQLAGVGMIGGGDVNGSPASPFAAQNAIYSSSPSSDPYPVFDPSTFDEESIFSEESNAVESVAEPTINLPLGTVVKGKIMHDVSFEDGSPSTDKAVVELTEALGDIPKGAMVSTEINGVDDSGALSMSILGFEHDNVYQSISLPEIQVTSAKASSGGGGLGRLFQDVVGIGLDVLNNETGQDIQFDDGRVASISTDTSNGFLDPSVEAVSSRLLERNRSSQSSSNRAPKVKEGSTVRFIVIEPFI